MISRERLLPGSDCFLFGWKRWGDGAKSLGIRSNCSALEIVHSVILSEAWQGEANRVLLITKAPSRQLDGWSSGLRVSSVRLGAPSSGFRMPSSELTLSSLRLHGPSLRLGYRSLELGAWISELRRFDSGCRRGLMSLIVPMCPMGPRPFSVRFSTKLLASSVGVAYIRPPFRALVILTLSRLRPLGGRDSLRGVSPEPEEKEI